MNNPLNDVIDKFLVAIEECYPNCRKFDLDLFVKSNKIDYKAFIQFIEDDDITNCLLDTTYFHERISLFENSYQNIFEEDKKEFAFKLFLKLVEYCYFLKNQDLRNNKETIFPSKEAYDYKMNNDNRSPRSRTHNADVQLFSH